MAFIRKSPFLSKPHDTVSTMQDKVYPHPEVKVVVVNHHREDDHQERALIDVDVPVERNELRSWAKFENDVLVV